MFSVGFDPLPYTPNVLSYLLATVMSIKATSDSSWHRREMSQMILPLLGLTIVANVTAIKSFAICAAIFVGFQVFPVSFFDNQSAKYG